MISKGFKLKWSEQTGFSSPKLTDSTTSLLRQTSLGLQHQVLEASLQKFDSTLRYLMGLKNVLPQSDWSKGISNYQFILNMNSTRHQNKISKLSTSTKLQLLFPPLSFTESGTDINVAGLLVSNPNVSTDNSSLELCDQVDDQCVVFQPSLTLDVSQSSDSRNIRLLDSTI